MQNVFCPKKSTYCIVGALELLGQKEYQGVESIVPTDPTLKIFVQSLRLNHVEVVELIFVGILLLGMNCHFTKNNLLTPREEIEMSD